MKEEGEQAISDLVSLFRGPCGSCELWGRLEMHVGPPSATEIWMYRAINNSVKF